MTIDLDALAAALEGDADELEQVRISAIEAHPRLCAAVDRIGAIHEGFSWVTDCRPRLAEIAGCGR